MPKYEILYSAFKYYVEGPEGKLDFPSEEEAEAYVASLQPKKRKPAAKKAPAKRKPAAKKK